ncbi:uncharacterized protein FMAN_14352 [Fusarium mangiferae]|uniref:Uncharacterized protein n=1 Tax=Fusarium mangiferae TaxID=192010 RepID=A0A1L7UHC9_FUSMA|nr:uncharacterized protein FMAN_14352 [Fusarium mangiferae]CVL07425.1 uncharacterized protein FMAN_14352 [Fusarium mangiferae]
MKHHQFVDGLLRWVTKVIKLASQGWGDNDPPFLIAVHQEDEDMVDLLLRTGQIDIRIRNEDGYTPLLIAVELRDLGIVKLLLEKEMIGGSQEDLEKIAFSSVKSIVDEYHEYYYTPQADFSSGMMLLRDEKEKFLWWAVKGERLKMIELILDESMVDTNRTLQGQTSLMWAIKKRKEDILKAFLSNLRVDLHFADKLGRTALSWALDYSKDRMVLLLLSGRGFSIQRESSNTSRKLFWWAIGRGNSGVIDMLHESGKYDINTRDLSGKTPFHYTAETCAEEALRVLLGTGRADEQAVDKWGDTALSIAMRRGYRTIMDLLSAYNHRSNEITTRAAD